MNEIAGLEYQIQEAESLREHYESFLAANPGDFVYEQSLESVKTKLAELQHELKFEKEAREIEVIRLSFKKVYVEGTIPLNYLSKIGSAFSRAIYYASQRAFTGREVKRLSPEIEKSIDLRLADLQPGSTNLIVVGYTDPNLLGESLLEQTLYNAFELLNAESIEELMETVSVIGKKSAEQIRALMLLMAEPETDISIEWYSPKAEHFRWDADKSKLLQVAGSLETIDVSPPEIALVSGRLSGINERGKFEITIHDTGELIRGHFPFEVIDKIKTARIVIGDSVDCTIEKSVTINHVTDYKKIGYSLLDIKKAS